MNQKGKNMPKEYPIVRLEDISPEPVSEEAGWSIREKIVEDVRRFVQRQGPRYPVNSEVKLRFG